MKRRVHVEFDVEVPVDEATDHQVLEWLRFALHDNGLLDGGNPMVDVEAEPVFGTFRVRHAAAPWGWLT